MSEWRGQRHRADGTLERYRAEDMGDYICIEQLSGFKHEDEAAHVHLPRDEFLRWARRQPVASRFSWLQPNLLRR